MSLEVQQLTKIYGQQKAIENISFNIDKGEIVGFLGPNGAGKSTTMKIITGYLKANAGTVKICDIDISINPIEAKKKIGYLPENNPLYLDMYVREYIQLIASIYKIKNKKSKTEDIITLTGLTPECNKKIGQLSKGYKQRVGLAAALVHDPEVLILDEPTTGLDPNQIIEIREVIKSLGQNKTVLFSSHIMQEVQAICDRIMIIHKGHIVANDTLKNLQKDNMHHIMVEFNETINIERVKILNEIENISQLSPTSFQITTANPENTKRQLLQFALNNNLNIVSLQSQNQNLETIFRQFTL